jgi:hypothetical protein
MGLTEAFHERDLERYREIVRDPLWYNEIAAQNPRRQLGRFALLHALQGDIVGLREAAKDHYYQIFEDLLAEGSVALGQQGYDWDSEREEPDTIVIHHTSNRPGITAARLSAMELLRIYVPTYAHPDEADKRRGIEGQPIYSGHFVDGKQVFTIYHWLVRPDGATERHLPDSAIGFHAGNWDINRRSIAICIDDDLRDREPTPETIQGIASIVRGQYPNMTISPDTIRGHREVRLGGPTECPGDRFLPVWKQTLIKALQ